MVNRSAGVAMSNAWWGPRLATQPVTAESFALVVGIFFFDDNAYALRAGDPIGERLAIVAKQTGMLLMACDPDQVISL